MHHALHPANGLVWDNIVDDGPKLQALVDLVGKQGGGRILLPSGTGRLRNSIRLGHDDVVIQYADGCRTNFDPPAAATLWHLEHYSAGGTLSRCGVTGAHLTSPNNVVPKTGFDLVNTSDCFVDHVTCTEGNWDSPGGIGFRFRGREFTRFGPDVTMACERPIVFDANPHNASISCDHFSWYSPCWLIGRGMAQNANLSDRPCVTKNPGCVVTSMNVFGVVSLNRGSQGIRWRSSGAGFPSDPQSSIGVNLSGFRREQGAYAWGYIDTTPEGQRYVDVRRGGAVGNFRVGMPVTISLPDNGNAETLVVQRIAGQRITFTGPLRRSHVSGEEVYDAAEPPYAVDIDGSVYDLTIQEWVIAGARQTSGARGIRLAGCIGVKLSQVFYEGSFTALELGAGCDDVRWDSFTTASRLASLGNSGGLRELSRRWSSNAVIGNSFPISGHYLAQATIPDASYTVDEQTIPDSEGGAFGGLRGFKNLANGQEIRLPVNIKGQSRILKLEVHAIGADGTVYWGMLSLTDKGFTLLQGNSYVSVGVVPSKVNALFTTSYRSAFRNNSGQNLMSGWYRFTFNT